MTALPAWAEAIIGISVVLGALGVITKFLHLHELGKGLLDLVRDWRGDPPRPGYDGRPSFPERMTKVEQRTGTLTHDLRGEIASRLQLVEDALQQLKRNGGSSVADKVHDTNRSVEMIAEAVERLEVTAQQNREGINDLSRRVTDMDEKVDTQSERITDHRRRNEQTITELREYLEAERDDLLIAKQALEASVTELLMVEGHQERDQ